jgi:hypothetical protein
MCHDCPVAQAVRLLFAVFLTERLSKSEVAKTIRAKHTHNFNRHAELAMHKLSTFQKHEFRAETHAMFQFA